METFSTFGRIRLTPTRITGELLYPSVPSLCRMAQRKPRSLNDMLEEELATWHRDLFEEEERKRRRRK